MIKGSGTYTYYCDYCEKYLGDANDLGYTKSTAKVHFCNESCNENWKNTNQDYINKNDAAQQMFADQKQERSDRSEQRMRDIDAAHAKNNAKAAAKAAEQKEEARLAKDIKDSQKELQSDQEELDRLLAEVAALDASVETTNPSPPHTVRKTHVSGENQRGSFLTGTSQNDNRTDAEIRAEKVWNDIVATFKRWGDKLKK
jgi:hypothetical protein